MRPEIAALAPASLALLLIASAGCILTDEDINVSDEQILNRNAVRIVEPLQLSREAREACNRENGGCPQPPPDPEYVLPHFLDPKEYVFCSCPMGSVDSQAQPRFSIYIEDRDQDADEQYDDIYAALFLDYTPDNPKPYTSIRYPEYVDPQEPIPLASSIEYQPIGRNDPILRELVLGNDSRGFDFCNAATDTALEAGFHTLTVVVSDRPWFTPEIEKDGEILKGVIQEGVPDFLNGASFDLSTYVFYCTAAEEDPCQASQCETTQEPL
ncbi:MAG TPA: hypothetical protein ENJ18_05505 [Nannocystis exedens]|nr:hypothetical protein [Nannocystis exedens]